MSDDKPMTTFVIERWSEVYLANHSNGLMTDKRALAWVRVGEITLNDAGWATAMREWESREDPEPPEGIYRVVQELDYGFTGREFEIVVRRSREIVPFDREQMRADLRVLSEAACTPAPNGEGTL